MPLLLGTQHKRVRTGRVSLVGPRECLHAIVKLRTLIWFGQVTRHYSLCKLTSREGTIDCIRR